MLDEDVYFKNIELQFEFTTGNPIPESGYLEIDLPPSVTLFRDNGGTFFSNVRCLPDEDGFQTCACSKVGDCQATEISEQKIVVKDMFKDYFRDVRKTVKFSISGFKIERNSISEGKTIEFTVHSFWEDEY